MRPKIVVGSGEYEKLDEKNEEGNPGDGFRPGRFFRAWDYDG